MEIQTSRVVMVQISQTPQMVMVDKQYHASNLTNLINDNGPTYQDSSLLISIMEIITNKYNWIY